MRTSNGFGSGRYPAANRFPSDVPGSDTDTTISAGNPGADPYAEPIGEAGADPFGTTALGGVNHAGGGFEPAGTGFPVGSQSGAPAVGAPVSATVERTQTTYAAVADPVAAAGPAVQPATTGPVTRTITMAGSGLTFNVTFDASVGSAPIGFVSAFDGAISFYETEFAATSATININVGWGEVNGTPIGAGDLGESLTQLVGGFTYSEIRSDLIAAARDPAQMTAVASLPAIDPTGGASFFVPDAEAKALGISFIPPAEDGSVGFDSTASFTFDPANRAVAGEYDFIGVAEHEISEVMGRISDLGSVSSGSLDPLDLFRYSAPGTRALTPSNGAYFSIDGGTTNINTYNGTGGGDLGDWLGTTADSYNAASNLGVANLVSPGDVTEMNVLGYDLAAPPSITAPAAVTVGVGRAAPISGVSINESSTTSGETFTVTLVDPNGLLSATGAGVSGSGSTSLTIAGSLGQVNSDLATLTDTEGTTGSDTITINSSDSNGGTANPKSIAVTVNGVPVITAPAMATVQQNQAAAIGGLSLSESGSTDAELFTVMITDSNGRLSAMGSGVTGIGTTSLTIAGTLNEVNADLATLADTKSALTPDTITVTASDSLGGSATPVTIAVTVRPPTPTDFNGDGHSDLLWQRSNGQPAIWLMNGTIPIAKADVGGNPGPSWHIRAAGDFNADGEADILWQNSSGEVDIWEMHGTKVIGSGSLGNPGPDWHAVATGDFNDDGHADILWQNSNGQAAIWLMNGTTPVSEVAIGPNPGPSWHVIGSGNFNHDGFSDILWQNSDGSVAIWEMIGTNVIGSGIVATNPGPGWHAIGAGNFFGNGDSDILWQNDDGSIAIWEMNGTNVVGSGTVATNPGPGSDAIGTGDYFGTGGSDILFQNSSGEVDIWQMNGTTIAASGSAGNPGPKQHAAGNSVPWTAAGADLLWQSDVTASILFQNDSGEADIWEMNGTSVIGGGSLGNPGPNWHLTATGDFYGNANPDLLWQNDSGEAYIWGLNGASVIGGASLGNPGPSWHIKATGDFNDDGKSDILWQNDSGEAYIWEMNGTSVIGSGSLGNPGPSWHVIGTGDFNHDGHADILWQNDSGEAVIWEMNGTSVIGGTSLGNPGPSWHAKGTGDFFGNGDSDILWQNDDGSVAIWEMSGTNIIGGGVVANPGPSWHVLGAGDYNKDGRSDILFQNSSGAVDIWEMSGASIIGGGNLGNPGPTWHV